MDQIESLAKATWLYENSTLTEAISPRQSAAAKLYSGYGGMRTTNLTNEVFPSLESLNRSPNREHF